MLITSQFVKKVCLKKSLEKNTIGVVVPLENDLILMSRLRGSFRHLKLQNMSIISGFRHLVPFFTTIGVVAPLENDLIFMGRSRQ